MNPLCIIILILLLIVWLIYRSNKEGLSNEKLNVAIVFSGLTRSLKFTIQSIKDNIFNVLDENNDINYDIYLHTWYFNGSYNNERAEEKDIKLDFNEYTLLNPTVYQIDDQDEYDKQMNSIYQKVKEYDLDWNLQTTFNVFRYFESMKRANRLWVDSDIDYDIILNLRPDMLCETKLNVKQFYDLLSLPNKDNIIYLPEWGSFDGYNDRLAFGTPSSMKIYTSVIDYLTSNYSKYGNYKHNNTEQRLKQILNENNIYSKNMDMKGYFIRANGEKKDRPR